MRRASSGTSSRSASSSWRAQLPTRHDLDLGVQRRSEGRDRSKLRVHICREEPPHNCVIAADLASKLRLRKTGVEAQGVECSHDLIDLGEFLPGTLVLGPELGVLHSLGDTPPVMAGVQHFVSPRSI
jgi:hypothetical protein